MFRIFRRLDVQAARLLDFSLLLWEEIPDSFWLSYLSALILKGDGVVEEAFEDKSRTFHLYGTKITSFAGEDPLHSTKTKLHWT